MKLQLVLLLFVVIQINCFSKNDFEDVMYGVAKGFDVSFGAEECVFYTQDSYEKMESAVADLESGDKDRQRQGLSEFVESLKGLPQSLHQCSALPLEVSQIQNTIESYLSDKKTFENGVLINFAMNQGVVQAEVKMAYDFFKQKDWINFGFNVGQALTTLLLGNPILKN